MGPDQDARRQQDLLESFRKTLPLLTGTAQALRHDSGKRRNPRRLPAAQAIWMREALDTD